MSKLIAYVSRGKYKGKPLYPHQHTNGKYIASSSRFEIDYINVDNENELETLVKSGLSARMSNSDIPNAPSLIVAKNIKFSYDKEPNYKLIDFLKNLTEDVDLNYDSKAKSRKEQSFLRAHLANGQLECYCAICGELFPIELLIAAHIKPRKNCDINEKLDFDNVAALMCKIGCDDLFEKGYIYIQNGIIYKNLKRNTTVYLDKIISNLENKTVKGWENSKKYYDFHRNLFVKKHGKK